MRTAASNHIAVRKRAKASASKTIAAKPARLSVTKPRSKPKPAKSVAKPIARTPVAAAKPASKLKPALAAKPTPAEPKAAAAKPPILAKPAPGAEVPNARVKPPNGKAVAKGSQSIRPGSKSKIAKQAQRKAPAVVTVPLAWDGVMVGRLNQYGVDLVMVDRPLLAGLADAMQTAKSVEHRTIVKRSTVVPTIQAALAAVGLQEAEIEMNLVTIVRSFLDQFGRGAANLKLEICADIVTAKFHLEPKTVRMISTLVGPGTEYIFRDRPTNVLRARTGACVFFKGTKHRSHSGSVLLRSPQIADAGKRLVLTVDF